MNGFMLFVLVVLASQVNTGGGPPMPSLSSPVQPASMITDASPQRDYGWQIHPETGELEYIVQLNEAKVQAMLSDKNKKQDFISPIPAPVAARVKKVVVRWGDDPIVSTPIEEVVKLPLVENPIQGTNLIGGQFKNLEQSRPVDVQNVSGGQQPPPLTPGGTNLKDIPDGIDERLAEAVRSGDLLAQNTPPRNGLGTNFANEASGRTTPGMTSLPQTAMPGAPNMPGTATGNLSGMPTSTATTPPSNTFPSSPNFNNVPSRGALDQLGQGTGTMTMGANTGVNNAYGQAASNGYAQPNNTNPNGYGQSAMGNIGNGYPNPGGMFTSTNPNTNTGRGGGFAQQPVGAPTTPWSSTATNNPTYGQGVLAQPQYSNNNSYANANQYPGNSVYTGTTNNPTTGTAPWLNDPPSVPRLADSRANVPGTGGAAVSGTGNGVRTNWNAVTDGYENEVQNRRNALAQRTAMENIMPVMFVLSLVVNFYLGMLIRKLLGRYRTLLASVRSQTV